MTLHGHDDSPSKGTSRHLLHCPKILRHRLNCLAKEHVRYEVALAWSCTDLHCLIDH